MKLVRLSILLFSFLLIVSCQKDENVKTDATFEEQQETISLNTFKKTDTYRLLKEELDSVSERHKHKRDASVVQYYATEEGVLPSYVDKGTTYSIPMVSSDKEINEKYELRLFVEKTSGGVSAYILKIPFEGEDFRILPVVVSGGESIIFEGARRVCTSIVVSYYRNCACAGHPYGYKGCVCHKKASGGTKVYNICYSKDIPNVLAPKINLGEALPLPSRGGGGPGGTSIYIGASSDVQMYWECKKAANRHNLSCSNLPKLYHKLESLPSDATNRNCPDGYFKDANGNCIESTPSNEAHHLIRRADFTSRVRTLQLMTARTVEAGYKENADGTFTMLKTNASGTVDIQIDIQTKGYMHTHLDDYKEVDRYGNVSDKYPIRIFSPVDVVQFLKIVKRAHYHPTMRVNEPYGVVISSTGNYMLKFDGNPDDILPEGDRNTLNPIYVAEYANYGGNIEKFFLYFLKDHINSKGLQLIRMEANGQLKLLTLDKNGNVQETLY